MFAFLNRFPADALAAGPETALREPLPQRHLLGGELQAEKVAEEDKAEVYFQKRGYKLTLKWRTCVCQFPRAAVAGTKNWAA